MAINLDSDSERLQELEIQWNDEFTQQPKLPTWALLSGALSMAMGFGGVLFFLFAAYRRYAWIWIALSLITGIAGWRIAARWYRHTVIPWDERRKKAAEEIQALKVKCKM